VVRALIYQWYDRYMRSLFAFMMVSLDGYFEGVDGDLSWHNVDGEFNDFAIKQLGEIDTLIFGRKTYEMMANYWPTEMAIADDPIVAERMNSIPKLVVSHSLKRADWNNTKLVSDPSQVIADLKASPGKSIAIFGSSSLCVSLIEMGLIDEFRLMYAPVLIGDGTSLFDGMPSPLKLELIDSKAYASGNVLMRYKPSKD